MKRILLKSTIENWEHTLTKQQIIESHERLRELLELSLAHLEDVPLISFQVADFLVKTKKELL